MIMKKERSKAIFKFSKLKIKSLGAKKLVSSRFKIKKSLPSLGPTPIISHKMLPLNKSYLTSTLPTHT
jgi:hypothetical protein